MIRLIRPEKPTQLDEKLKMELTEKFKNTESSVWRERFIVESLLNMSSEKCAFCECRLLEEGKYMQVEHFLPKSLYPNEVIEWTNLLPVCNRCNIKKSNHDTKTSPIINPTEEDPRDSLEYCLSEFRIVGSNEKGELTEEIIDLNDLLGLGMTRFVIWQELVSQLREFESMLNDFDPTTSKNLKKIRLQNKFKQIMNSGIPQVQYSATAATLIKSYPKYSTLKKEMQQKQLWDEEMGILEMKVNSVAFKIRENSNSQSNLVI